jgi:hypothetical protein
MQVGNYWRINQDTFTTNDGEAIMEAAALLMARSFLLEIRIYGDALWLLFKGFFTTKLAP